MVRKLVVLCVVFLVVNCAVCYADSWDAFYYSRDWDPDLSPLTFTFTLNNGVLLLNDHFRSDGSGSSSQTWELLLSGQWAICGTVDSTGHLIPDPYAKFVYDRNYGSGHIEWAPGTPLGYAAPLMLGASFDGNGAATYFAQYHSDEPVIATIVVANDAFSSQDEQPDYYWIKSHTFYTTLVPEPSGLLSLLGGISGLGGVGIWRKRRNRH